MSSRDYIRVLVSNTSPAGARVGDEYFDPGSNRLYQTLPINGTTVTNTEILTNGPALSSTSINVGGVRIVNYTLTSNTNNTGALVVNGGVGVGDSVYVGNRIGFAYANSSSAAYQVYNPLGSIDVTFG